MQNWWTGTYAEKQSLVDTACWFHLYAHHSCGYLYNVEPVLVRVTIAMTKGHDQGKKEGFISRYTSR